MRGTITLSIEIEDGGQPLTLTLRSTDWSTGDNPRYIAPDAAAAIDKLSSSVQAHLAQEFGDIRQSERR
ncbi:hypothetical protein [Nocardia gipuzkoensis]|uniref:hypothetical protein n=1 Tax=Nocardia gipuzkoensis TaxID=2749991 RepID=UPI00237E2560|nr:hypothetical protein [Nocardia gipuzkoensis]MDE1673848.1 hypothetical protein [Nocardia gipuzkoensis]